MKQIKFLALCFMLIFMIGQAKAQYTGPNSKGKLQTIEYVKANASSLDKSDELIQLRGYIVEKITKENYWFKDSTGKIIVEIEKDDMPSMPFDDKTEIIIIGEIDYDVLEEVELEVEDILFVKP